MSHDNRIYVNTTQNNLVVIDSEHNQLTVTHPITQVIEITQSPRPTIIVTEETPNNVSVTEAVGNTVIVSATGPQGIKGDRGSDPELTALELFTASIQTQVNNLATATSSYVLNSITASMLQPYVLTAVTSSMTVLSSSFASTASFATSIAASILNPYVLTSSTSSMRVLSSSFALTASRLEGSFRLTTTGNAAAQTISALGGLAFNNLATMDIDGTGTLYVKTTTTDVSGLATRLMISGSGQIGIGTSTPLSNLHVHKDASGAPILGIDDGITLTLENDTTNYINFRTPNTVYAGLAFTTPADNSAGYIALRQSTGDMVFSNEKSTGYHTFQTADTERLRIANTETTVRNNLIVSGATSQFTASGDSVLTGRVHIGPTPPTLVTSQLTINHNTQFFGDVFLYSNSAIQGGTSGRAYFWFGAVGDSYINNGNFGVGTMSPSCSLDVKGTARISGSLTVTGSVTFSSVLTLAPQHPLPSVNLSIGSFAVSSSTPPKPYFWDGNNWYALY